MVCEKVMKTVLTYDKILFTMRHYTCVVYVVIVSVHPSQVRVLPRQLNLRPHKQRRPITHGLFKFSDTKDLGEIPAWLPPTGAPTGSVRRWLQMLMCINNCKLHFLSLHYVWNSLPSSKTHRFASHVLRVGAAVGQWTCE